MSVTTPAAPEPGASPTPRRVATPRWLDVRLVLGVVLVLASVLIGARIVSGADHTYRIAAANHDLAAGTTLTASDVRMVQVQLPGHGRGLYVQSAKAAVGRTLSRDVAAGELLTDGTVTTTPVHTTITVALGSGAAPDLRTGQRITVWLTTPTCPSVVLLADVAVQSVRRDDAGTFDSGTGGQDVVVDVDPDSAQRVNAALSSQDSSLRAGVLSGPVSSSRTLPDLTSCLAGK